MKTVYLVVSLGLIVFAGVAEAEAEQKTLPRCQQLAQDFANNPDSLQADRLKQLQYCINQALTQQKATNPPRMLKGTIIEPLSSSETSSPTVPKNAE